MSAARDLPARPSLDSLRKQAKRLARDAAAGNGEAIARVHAQLSRATLPLSHRDAQLVIVGGASGDAGGEEAGRIRALVDELDLNDRVHFVEPQPHHILSTYYRAADVVLVPSRSESFGLVALEAAACGIPVVASAVGGLLSLVDDRVTGRGQHRRIGIDGPRPGAQRPGERLLQAAKTHFRRICKISVTEEAP